MGINKLGAIWKSIQDSLWFLPALLTLVGIALAVLMVELDYRGILPERDDPVWLYTGSSAGARGVLTAIAQGIITVTGVVFSVTIVALQLASTQYSPRVLRNFVGDRASQVVLGVFIGTFTYALLVLRVVRGEDPVALEEEDYFIPHLSIVVAVILTLVSIGFLIFFINHLARSIQASVIIHRVTRDTLDTMKRLVPERFGEPAEMRVEGVTPRAQGTIVTARESGYVQGIDPHGISALLDKEMLTIRLDREVGDFVLTGSVLGRVWPATVQDDGEVADSVRRSYILGVERTQYMDIEHGVIELVDMAIKGLSPSVNDPTTAVLCVDRLAEILLALAHHGSPGRVRRRENGGVLILPRTEFERLVDTAFDQIRHFGVGNPQFAAALLDRLAQLGELLPRDATKPVEGQVGAIMRDARRRIEDPTDLGKVEDAARRALQALDGAGRTS